MDRSGVLTKIFTYLNIECTRIVVYEHWFPLVRIIFCIKYQKQFMAPFPFLKTYDELQAELDRLHVTLPLSDDLFVIHHNLSYTKGGSAASALSLLFRDRLGRGIALRVEKARVPKTCLVLKRDQPRNEFAEQLLVIRPVGRIFRQQTKYFRQPRRDPSVAPAPVDVRAVSLPFVEICVVPVKQSFVLAVQMGAGSLEKHIHEGEIPLVALDGGKGGVDRRIWHVSPPYHTSGKS